MGKGGRIACIITPMALTVASLIALAFIDVSGWSANSPLNNNYLMSADFSNFTVSDAGSLSNSTELTAALTLAQSAGVLKKSYRVYLWSYCTADKSVGDMDWCSKKSSSFVFDPVEIFALNTTSASAGTGTSSADNALESTINNVKNNAEGKLDDILGDSATGALKVYKKVAKWNFYAYQIAFWTTVITIVVGLLAICSRWGSLCTWIMAGVSLPPILQKHIRKTNANFIPGLHALHLPRQSYHYHPLLDPHRCSPHHPRSLPHQSNRRYPRPCNHLDRDRSLNRRDLVLVILCLLLLWSQQPSPPLEQGQPMERGAQGQRRRRPPLRHEPGQDWRWLRSCWQPGHGCR
jgi:hypothetical protein